jgi:eukaryotic translation initiation factor 2C
LKEFAERRKQREVPKLLFMVVVKRHHLRTKMLGSGTNPPPGCVIESQIVDKARQNFYLYSHKAVAGTARPTHYQLLYSDFGEEMPLEKIANVTFYLAHLHQTCTKSISIPAPVSLADKAAGRIVAYGDKCKPKREYRMFMI